MNAGHTTRIAGKTAELGEGLGIARFLPSQARRMIGAWIFLDHIGPANISQGKGVQVGPHPHTGLQTFTWMIAGELLHRDSLDTVQKILPGQVNLMTAGRGISHSEESPQPGSDDIHAVQLWIALPDDKRFINPAFEHHPILPHTQLGSAQITVMAGSLLDLVAPTTIYSPLVAAEIVIDTADVISLPLDPGFEYGLLVLSGEVRADGEALDNSELLYCAAGRRQIKIDCRSACRLLLIGGLPFDEEVLIWWNFLGREQSEIHRYVRSWNNSEDFGEVNGFDGARLTAPEPPWPNSP